jgi:hypothetical protein
VSAKEATDAKGRTQTMGGSVVTADGTVIDPEGNVRDEDGNIVMTDLPPPPPPTAPPTVETQYEKEQRERRELERRTVEMEEMDPDVPVPTPMDTSAVGGRARPTLEPVGGLTRYNRPRTKSIVSADEFLADPTRVDELDDLHREEKERQDALAPPRTKWNESSSSPVGPPPPLGSPPSGQAPIVANVGSLRGPDEVAKRKQRTVGFGPDEVAPPAPTLGQLASAVGITGGDAMARKQKRNERRQALGRLDEEQRRAQQRQATQSTDTTASEMTARMAEPAGGDSPRYNRPRSKSIVSPPSSLATQEEATIPPVQRHSEMTQIPGMRQSTSAIQGHGVDEPEALKEALRRSRMGSRVAQAVQDIEGPVGRRTPVLVDPADEEEEKEETDGLQESKMPDDDLESYEEMREGIERSEMGVEDVRLPMPAVRQEYGQRASLRIAGARGTFNRNFSSYDRVPMESKYPGLRVTDIDVRRDTPYGGFQPLRPLRAQVLAHQKEPRADVDWSKHRLEKRARATIALLEDTQPRNRARNINTNITPQQSSSAQSRMQQYRQVTRGLNEAEVFRGTNRVDRYNTQPAITVSAEPVVPAEPVATVELDEGGDEL